MKKLLILCPIAIIAIAIYVMTIRTKATQTVSTDKYEHYYNNNQFSYSNSENDESNYSSVTVESSVVLKDAVKPVDTDINSVTLLVNKNYTLKENYVPADLVVPNIKFAFSYYDPKMQLRQVAADAMENLFNAAKQQGCSLAGVSGYRSYKRQFEIYAANLIRKGIVQTNQYSALAGTSEHQTGLAMDISTASINYNLSDSFANTKEGQWLAEHCHEYGFIIRYPANKTQVTGYAYEPWHIRYVGIELATYLTEHNLTLDEYYGYTFNNQNELSIDYDKIINDYYVMKGLKPAGNSTTVSNSSNQTNIPAQIIQDSNIGDSDDDIADSSSENRTETSSSSNKVESSKPTAAPTAKPTQKPTQAPTVPTQKPTHTPTTEPTKKPTQEVTQAPTSKPTDTPAPESTPTEAPVDTPAPTDTPTPSPEPNYGVPDPDTGCVIVTPPYFN